MREMNIALGYVAWLFCVAGAVISSLPQWFIVALRQPAATALYVGIPILLVGAILLVVAWLPEARRPYPEILETTGTPIPQFYLDQK